MNQTFETLYARDSKGKILEWTIEVQGGMQVDIKKAYGEYKSDKTLRWQRDIQGKNLGKANATNAFEQAVLQAESAIRLKKKKGYVSLEGARKNREEYALNNLNEGITKFRSLIEDVRDRTLVELEQILPKNRTDADGHTKPMKAQQYYRSKKPWIDPYGVEWSDRKYFYILNPNEPKEKGAIITKFPCMGQPKINGVRTTGKDDAGAPLLKSKEGKTYVVAHINDFLTMNFDIFDGDKVLDGELYIHDMLLQDIGSAINKPNLNTPRVVYILFDLAIEGTNLERWNLLKTEVKPKLEQHLNCPIQIIRTVKIMNDAHAQKFTDECIAQGYEGAIFRQMGGEYSFGGRPQAMTKLKRTISDEFTIVDVVPQDKDNTKGNFICATKEGLRFAVNPKGDDSFKRMVLYARTDFIGKPLTCDFYEWTKIGLPFHILNNTVRDYE